MNTTQNRTLREGSERTIAIGDVHGSATALRTLLELVRPTARDEIIFLGDLIDNGPDSRGVLELVMRLGETCRVISLRGNHEEMLLGARDSRSELLRWLHFGGAKMLDSYGASGGGWEIIPPDHIRFLEASRLYYETKTHIFVHANVDPDLPMSQQTREVLLWQFLDAATARPHVFGKTVVVGHTPQPSGDVLDLGHTVCIDTACWNGGCLSALDVTTGRVWQATTSGKTRVSGLK